jgi:hypothetical protein
MPPSCIAIPASAPARSAGGSNRSAIIADVGSGLESANLKVARATEQLGTISRIITDATSRPNSHEIVEDANGKKAIKFLIEPPPEVAILVGEIVYQLRSALDHLAFELVQLNSTKITLPKNWEKRCEFPLWFTKRRRAGQPLTYNCFSDVLPGISKDAVKFIEGVQPYHSGAGAHNALRLVALLSNIDKHRHLNVILPKAAQYHHLVLSGGRGYSFGRGGLMDGAEIDKPPVKADDILDVKTNFMPYLTFDEPTVGSGTATLEVEKVLEVCLEQVKTVIVPAFTRLLRSP